MAIEVDLPIDLMKTALDGAISLRKRNATAATNPVIKQAYEQEVQALSRALDTIKKVPSSNK